MLTREAVNGASPPFRGTRCRAPRPVGAEGRGLRAFQHEKAHGFLTRERIALPHRRDPSQLRSGRAHSMRERQEATAPAVDAGARRRMAASAKAAPARWASQHRHLRSRTRLGCTSAPVRSGSPSRTSSSSRPSPARTCRCRTPASPAPAPRPVNRPPGTESRGEDHEPTIPFRAPGLRAPESLRRPSSLSPLGPVARPRGDRRAPMSGRG